MKRYGIQAVISPGLAKDRQALAAATLRVKAELHRTIARDGRRPVGRATVHPLITPLPTHLGETHVEGLFLRIEQQAQ